MGSDWVCCARGYLCLCVHWGLTGCVVQEDICVRDCNKESMSFFCRFLLHGLASFTSDFKLNNFSHVLFYSQFELVPWKLQFQEQVLFFTSCLFLLICI